MPANKYIANNAGQLTEVVATVVSSGVSQADKVVALDANGKLDLSLFPTGIVPETAIITTSESLSAGDFVNIWNSTGAKARKADASTVGKEAHGFVLSAFASAAAATVYFEGTNNQVSGATPGVVFLATTPGASTATAPSAAGNVVQRIGFATAATAINFQSNDPILLA